MWFFFFFVLFFPYSADADLSSSAKTHRSSAQISSILASTAVTRPRTARAVLQKDHLHCSLQPCRGSPQTNTHWNVQWPVWFMRWPLRRTLPHTDIMDMLVCCVGFLRSHCFFLVVHTLLPHRDPYDVIATSCRVRALSVNIKNLNPLLSVFLSLPSCEWITLCYLHKKVEVKTFLFKIQ